MLPASSWSRRLSSMGVLDDAIREHLELKRKHGASEGEVEQQEQEALGAPLGRPVEPAEAAANGEAVEQEPAVEEPPAPQSEEPVAVEDPEPDIQEPEVYEPEPIEEPAAEEPQDDEPDWDFEPEPAEPPAEPEPEADADGDTPPRGFERVEEAGPAPAEGDDEEDVLEETPDFLQETPEHDRLWFEQKPPRDFDFDDDK
jgi:hypothetical protein